MIERDLAVLMAMLCFLVGWLLGIGADRNDRAKRKRNRWENGPKD